MRFNLMRAVLLQLRRPAGSVAKEDEWKLVSRWPRELASIKDPRWQRLLCYGAT
jgi:hypothetical protein